MIIVLYYCENNDANLKIISSIEKIKWANKDDPSNTFCLSFSLLLFSNTSNTSSILVEVLVY